MQFEFSRSCIWVSFRIRVRVVRVVRVRVRVGVKLPRRNASVRGFFSLQMTIVSYALPY